LISKILKLKIYFLTEKDESCEKLVIAKIGGPLVLVYGVCAGTSEVEIVDWMFDKIR